MNKCIKIVLDKCLNIDIRDVKKIIRDMSYSSCKASNKAIRMWLYHAEDMIQMKNNDKEFNQKEYEKNTYGKTYQNVIEGEMKLLMGDCNTSNVGTLHQQSIMNTWGRLKKDILSCKVNLPTFKIDTPYYFKNCNFDINKNDKNKYEVGLSFFSKSGMKKYGFKVGEQIIMEVDKLGKSEKTTIDKIIKGKEFVNEIDRLKTKMRDKTLAEEDKIKLKNQLDITKNTFEELIKQGQIYKQGSAQIQISKKGKIELTISYTFDTVKEELDVNRILGIDLGIVNVATMSIYDVAKDEYDYVNYRHNILNGKELISFRQKLFNIGISESEIEKEIFKHNNSLHQKQLNKCNIGCIDGLELNRFRNTVEEHRKELSIASKCAGNGRVGHGYKTKMKNVNKLRDRISNFADTFNHKYSKYIVDFAVKNNCGVIQMEDLSGATANTNEKFLKSWSYYDLQSKIEYKANEKGIKVIKVNPKYTSKRCNKCGNIHNDNRDCKNNQAKFKCTNPICNHEDNADVNASKNIAIPHIDTIINQYIKETKKAS